MKSGFCGSSSAVTVIRRRILLICASTIFWISWVFVLAELIDGQRRPRLLLLLRRRLRLGQVRLRRLDLRLLLRVPPFAAVGGLRVLRIRRQRRHGREQQQRKRGCEDTLREPGELSAHDFSTSLPRCHIGLYGFQAYRLYGVGAPPPSAGAPPPSAARSAGAGVSPVDGAPSGAFFWHLFLILTR